MRLWKRDASLFLTHTPAGFKVGDIYKTEGKRYRITRVKQIAPTRLLDGGTAECFEVFGREVEERTQ